MPSFNKRKQRKQQEERVGSPILLTMRMKIASHQWCSKRWEPSSTLSHKNILSWIDKTKNPVIMNILYLSRLLLSIQRASFPKGNIKETFIPEIDLGVYFQ
jgi:hypothetical protein